jgi:hypothetical protein
MRFIGCGLAVLLLAHPAAAQPAGRCLQYLGPWWKDAFSLRSPPPRRAWVLLDGSPPVVIHARGEFLGFSPDGRRAAFFEQSWGESAVFRMVDTESAAILQENQVSKHPNASTTPRLGWDDRGGAWIGVLQGQFNGTNDADSMDIIRIQDGSASVLGRYPGKVTFDVNHGRAFAIRHASTLPLLSIDLETGVADTVLSRGRLHRVVPSPRRGVVAVLKHDSLLVVRDSLPTIAVAGRPWGCAWSPDGRHVAWTNDHWGTGDLTILDLETGVIRKAGPRGGWWNYDALSWVDGRTLRVRQYRRMQGDRLWTTPGSARVALVDAKTLEQHVVVAGRFALPALAGISPRPGAIPVLRFDRYGPRDWTPGGSFSMRWRPAFGRVWWCTRTGCEPASSVELSMFVHEDYDDVEHIPLAFPSP